MDNDEDRQIDYSHILLVKDTALPFNLHGYDVGRAFHYYIQRFFLFGYRNGEIQKYTLCPLYVFRLK